MGSLFLFTHNIGKSCNLKGVIKIYLEHHGIKGQKHGVRRGPPYPLKSEQKTSPTTSRGLERLKKAKTQNLDKWGKDANHNVCYIGGYSGSGKSTVALSLKDKNTDVIHLDVYYQKPPKGEESYYNDFRNIEFNSFLKSRGLSTYIDSKKPNSYDKFEQAVDDFGKAQFKKGRKVIAEGVQVIDSGLWVDKKHYADKPVILLNTSARESIYRMAKRTSEEYSVDMLTAVGGIKGLKKKVDDYVQFKSSMKNFKQSVNVKKGENWVKDYLKKVS